MRKTYDECCKYILEIPKFAGKNTLEDTYNILSELYDEKKSKVIHIAGTNGKGSTTEYLRSILNSMGFKVGVFTSPHLVDMTERICVDGVQISKDCFLESFEKVMKVISQKEGVSHPSFFEFLFLMAMQYFNNCDVDYILLETGLGGRCDATNCIKNKTLSIITSIGMDHMEYLGNDIASIAKEKAGIIKESVPVIFWDNCDESTKVILDTAKALKCKTFKVTKSEIEMLSLTKRGIDFSYRCGYYNLCGLQLNTQAAYQTENASLSIMAAFVIEPYLFSEKTIKQGLLSAFWPGRMEEILDNVFLDGAHNEAGIDAFLNTVKTMDECNLNPLLNKRILLFSAVKDKEYDKMIMGIVSSNKFDTVFVTSIPSQRGMKAESLGNLFTKCGCKDVRIFEGVKEAFSEALNLKKENDELYIVGSLYLVGHIKATLI